MRSRRDRFARLLALRQRELDDRKSEAARARTALRETRFALEQAQTTLRTAAEKWRVPAGEERRADEWTEAGDWLKAKIKGVEQAMHTHHLAKERIRVTGLAVQAAEREKKKIEKMLERIIEEERREAVVRDQKETDEVAARRTSKHLL
jgi:flagellar export protein FliJ